VHKINKKILKLIAKKTISSLIGLRLLLYLPIWLLLRKAKGKERRRLSRRTAKSRLRRVRDR